MENTNSRKLFLEKLGSGEEFLKIFELIPEISFFLKDRDCRFIALNQRGCDYCGVSEEKMALGLTDHDFFPKQRADAYREDDLQVMATDTPILDRIESAPEVEGSPRLVMTSKLPLHDSQGKVVGVFGISRQVDRFLPTVEPVEPFAEVIQYMHDHFGETVSTQELATMAGLSLSQFERRFRNAFGTSPWQFLLRVRTENACRMLAESSESLSQIAAECGFHDQSHFTKHLKKRVGMSPNEYRKRHHL